MNLDLRTIFALLLVSSVLMALTLAIGIGTGGSKGFARWNLGLVLYALGWVLLASREALPPIIGVALGDALLLAGICWQLSAMLEFGGIPSHRLVPAVPALALFAATVLLLENYRGLTLVVSVAYAAALGGIAVCTARLGPAVGPVRWMIVITYGTGAVMVMLRAENIWRNHGLHPGLFASNALHNATFIVMFATTIVGSTAFLLMHRQRAEAELHRLATFDPLTELFNRRAFGELAEKEIARARRSGAPLAVLMMDLDCFKRINDRYGHQAGDHVLAGFARAARSCVRAGDLVARYGGEEFCVLLPGAPMTEALEIAERLRRLTAQEPLGGLPEVTTVSIGASVCDLQAGMPLDDAIARADEALYRAKHAGRNQVAGADPPAQPDPDSSPRP